MRNVLKDEKPDLVVLNGDLITGENTFLSNSTLYLNTIVSPLLETNTPWASTYGNHDTAFNLSSSALFFQESLHPLSYTQHSSPGIPGITNYYLPIYSSSSPTTPAVILYFFDSRGGMPFQEIPTPENAIPNWVTSPVVSWFLSTSISLTSQYGKEIPSLAFVHIPPTNYLDFQSAELGGIGNEDARFPGVNDDEVVHQGSGWGQEGESGGLDAGFMDALKQAGVHSLYVGHDHGDAWCGSPPFSSTSPKFSKSRREQKEGPFLCFSKHTGYGGYGTWNRGSRNIRISFNEEEEMVVETWVRMENGDVIQKVSLNSTYGVDVYSMEDGE
ncbi:hypothetical protein B7494_g4472 [Chlorociboria aeruginascens]|nr:hypothetical protein B7494_g4472 [Chlorociboria aeruginascens]